MGWGSSWDDKPEFKQTKTHTVIYSGPNMFPEINHVVLGVDLSTQPDMTAYHQFKNNKPTHDPYTNPNATIYYECGCGAILDPKTKSFAALNNYASDKGWKIRFGHSGYTPYCAKCGEDVE